MSRVRYSIYELEYVRPLAVVLAAVGDPGGLSLEEVARRLREKGGLETWPQLVALRLARDPEKLELLLDLYRRGAQAPQGRRRGSQKATLQWRA